MKYGKIKHEHSMLEGLGDLLRELTEGCPGVQRVVPGRIHRRRGKGPAFFKVQYPTPAGLKCLYLRGGATQEVFLVGSELADVQLWVARKFPVRPEPE